jgi:hypothetical protein
MDSSGHIYDIIRDPSGEEKLTNKSPGPVPDPLRGVLVMQALEAAPMWWPELAPLTPEERRFVLDRLGRASTLQAAKED